MSVLVGQRNYYHYARVVSTNRNIIDISAVMEMVPTSHWISWKSAFLLSLR